MDNQFKTGDRVLLTNVWWAGPITIAKILYVSNKDINQDMEEYCVEIIGYRKDIAQRYLCKYDMLKLTSIGNYLYG